MRFNDGIVAALQNAGYTSSKIAEIIKERESCGDPQIDIRTTLEPDLIDILSIDELREAGVVIQHDEEVAYLEGLEA